MNINMDNTTNTLKKIKLIVICVFMIIFSLIAAAFISALIFLIFRPFIDYFSKSSQIVSNFGQIIINSSSIVWYICAIIVLNLGCCKKEKTFAQNICFYPEKAGKRKSFDLIVFGFGCGIVAQFLTQLIFSSTAYGMKLLEKYTAQTNEVLSGSRLWLSLLIFVFIAPVCEEIIFRGFILNYIKYDFSPAFSVIFTALIFSFTHSTVVQISYAFILGVILTLFALKFSNVIYSTAIHFGFNLTVPFTILINNSQRLTSFISSGTGIIIYTCFGIALVILSMFFFFNKKEESHI